MFLRGSGYQASYHYGAVGHSSGALGQIQGDAIRNIYGYFTTYGGIHLDGGAGAMFSYSVGGRHISARIYNNSNVITGIDASRYVPTDVENRPVNMAVRYLIRAQ